MTFYHVKLRCVSKNKNTIIVLKRQEYQLQDAKSFIAKNKSHRFNFTGWVTTYKIKLSLRIF